MASIINIKNAFFRKSLIVITFLPFLFLVVVFGAFKGAMEYVADFYSGVISAWKGRYSR